MITIAASHLTAVREASNAEDLHQSIQNSIDLEFSTIPPYLSAWMSLQPDKNSEIEEILYSVAKDEMLHMLITCNLLVALNGTPVIDTPDFVPTYPASLPMSVHPELTVGCEPFSCELVEKTFMEIEEPEVALEFPEARLRDGFPTIGLYYQALKAKLEELGNAAFRGDATGQLIHGAGFPHDRLFAIVDVESAKKAIDLIVTEGEGTSKSPVGGRGKVAHYYRFEQILKGHMLVADASVPQGFSFTGDPVPFDAGGVLPITANQKLADLDADSEAGKAAHHFSDIFTKMLKALHRTFNGEPGAYQSEALRHMGDLTVAGQTLCATDAVSGGHPTGRKAGPTFEYLAPNS
jgi:Ferritin-like